MTETTEKLPELPEEAAHMYPCDLTKFRRGEHMATAFSIKVGSPTHGTSEPLFTADQMREYVLADRRQRAALEELEPNS
jgi:hypothetical protein